jgi:hypothetical protein
MTLNLDDLIVTTFATGLSEEERFGESAVSRGCPQSWATNCLYTCVTCNGCESGTGGAC